MGGRIRIPPATPSFLSTFEPCMHLITPFISSLRLTNPLVIAMWRVRVEYKDDLAWEKIISDSVFEAAKLAYGELVSSELVKRVIVERVNEK